jgi:hypothetical protein
VRTRSRRLVTAASAFTFALALFAAPALAQIEPPPLPLPTPPEQLQPVLEVVAPVASPQCGNATLVVAIGPSVVPVPLSTLPINPLPLLGPVFVLCGSVPVPSAKSQLVCAVDDQIVAALNQATVAAAGTPLPVDVRVVGPTVEALFVLQDKLPPPASTAGLAETAKATLACRFVREASTSSVAPPDVAPEVAADTSVVEELALPDLTTGDIFFPLDTPASPELAAPTAQTPALRPVVEIGGPGFAYPVVFILPLLLLVIGGYLGWALTQPVDPPQR